ncbi:WG repeat-containing protein [Plantactinospora sonchi]|uniref:WG repeat-containing protein n=1 Tax=Plantactinospora sonchi TaxID=1544735 RepID=A0ABU7S120_9ACTN
MPTTGPVADHAQPGPLADAAPATPPLPETGQTSGPALAEEDAAGTADPPAGEPPEPTAEPAARTRPPAAEPTADTPPAGEGLTSETPSTGQSAGGTASAGPVDDTATTGQAPAAPTADTAAPPTTAAAADTTASATTGTPPAPSDGTAASSAPPPEDPGPTPVPAPPATDSGSADGPVSGPPLDTSPPDSPVAEASPDTVLPAGPAAGAATALSAPTMLTPIIRPRAGREAEPEPEESTPEPATADPEQVLASYEWRFHHETLRELVENPDELRAIRDRLSEKLEPAKDNGTRARLLSLRAVVSRILGDLGKALADGKLALAHAEATGQLRRIAIAQARLAHVLQWRGDFAEADRLFGEANSPELPDRLRATMHEHAGRSCYDQGRYMEACNHFEKALELRKVEDPDLIARTELALDAVFNKVAQNGWGPYPRDRDEILQVHKPPVPTFSEKVQRWGYADPDGQLAIAPSYADVQPFRDGAAWVRRPETPTWELIDESGALLVEATAGYLAVSSFSDGLAWVSRDGTGGWIAIDKANKVVIPTGFEDVRPFRRGVAAVRRGGWGAVDRTGKVFLPTRYTGFATALTDGRYVDGFTDEGLAIVDASGRKGVVDKSGQVIVPPAHPAMVIHPVAFLIGDGAGRWGALDRRGEPLIDVLHPSRSDVIEEIDRLLADTKPVL